MRYFAVFISGITFLSTPCLAGKFQQMIYDVAKKRCSASGFKETESKELDGMYEGYD